jgi:hypothetical protein
MRTTLPRLATTITASIVLLLTANALATSDTYFRDPTGRIETVIRVCTITDNCEWCDAFCDLPQNPSGGNFILVGGGAEVYPADGNPGALLYGSWPDGNSNFQYWRAASKDHGQTFFHRLRAYAIGLRLIGHSQAALQPYISYTEVTSGSAEHPSVTASVPSGHTLIGGGAIANWTGPGLLLMESYSPDGHVSWYAEATDYVYIEYGTVTAYAIGIADTSPLGVKTMIFNEKWWQSPSQCVNTWYGGGASPVVWDYLRYPLGFVPTSVGGRTQGFGNQYGRLLTQLRPWPLDGAQVKVSSKDHMGYAFSGTTCAYRHSILGYWP